MKKEVKVIKGDTTLKRTASGCVERSIKRVAAYCRVSTDTEDQINSYNSQVEHYTEFIQKNNEWTLAGIYADATVIIGLKQNPTYGRRFSPIFCFIEHF